MGATPKIELSPAEETYRIPGLPEEHQPGALEKPLANAAPVLPMAPAEPVASTVFSEPNEPKTDAPTPAGRSLNSILSQDYGISQSPDNSVATNGIALPEGARAVLKPGAPRIIRSSEETQKEIEKQLANHHALGTIGQIATAIITTPLDSVGKSLAAFPAGFQRHMAENALVMQAVRNSTAWTQAIGDAQQLLLTTDLGLNLVGRLEQHQIINPDLDFKEKIKQASAIVVEAASLQIAFKEKQIVLADKNLALAKKECAIIALYARQSGYSWMEQWVGMAQGAGEIIPAFFGGFVNESVRQLTDAGEEVIKVPAILGNTLFASWYKGIAIGLKSITDELAEHKLIVPMKAASVTFTASTILATADTVLMHSFLPATATVGEKVLEIVGGAGFGAFLAIPVGLMFYLGNEETKHSDNWQETKKTRDGKKAEEKPIEGQFQEVKDEKK